ncbi:MAG: hypothetical protein B7Z80_16615 [Rhodospirillales bacterium 20-64-7]|nr:MAG: hypothetical protein B7Z80_16615 [Rhodospirillales bacterium 20-64-7]
MDWEQILRSNGLDRYDRNARLYPAFLSLLPVFVVIAVWLPPVWTLLGGLISLASACGLIFFLAQIVRYLGRQVEKRLGDRVGRARSAVLLSHGDTLIAADTKARYHRYLADHGIKVPDRDLETRNPAAAIQGFRSAVDWLLEHTRPNAQSSMLLNENIAYGFRRNLVGLKPVAIALLVVAIAINAYLIATKDDQSRMVAAGAVELFFLMSLIAWIYVVGSAFVEDASVAYAQRFLAQCEHPSGPQNPRNPRRSATTLTT